MALPAVRCELAFFGLLASAADRAVFRLLKAFLRVELLLAFGPEEFVPAIGAD